MLLKVGNFSIIVEIAPKNTIWSIHPRNRRDSPAQRIDILIGFNRVYIRSIKKYCYQMFLGRLMILFAIDQK